MSRLYQDTKKWVEENCFNAKHLIRTAYWVKKLDPKVDEAVLLAALTHDVDRGLSGLRKVRFPKGLTDKEYVHFYKKHSLEAAKIVADFLKKEEASERLIKKVKNLIENHEFGGTYEQDLVRDADSISFLEVAPPAFIRFIPQKRTKDEVRRKFKFMFERITLPEAKKIAKPFFEKAITELEKVKE